ncbi:MAG: hypothetical protein FJ352_02695 [Firmicutes bacterium]|nr:hypothetical protein [Bacillota bacterium]
MFEEPLEENIQQDLEKEAYERKKTSLRRMTIFIWIVNIGLAIYVIFQMIAYVERLLNN